MKIKVLEEKGNILKLKFSDANAYFVNSLRRTILSKVNTFAVDYVDITENSSPLYNEILAHRIGLIPFKGDRKALKPKAECDCKDEKDCNNCEIKFVLKKEGPGYVYSGDIKIVGDALEPVYKKIPITYLTEKQKIDLEGAIVLGNSDEHAKFQAAIVGYNYENDDKYNSETNKTEKDSNIIMTIESVSGLNPRDVILEAIDTLDKDLQDLDNLIK